MDITGFIKVPSTSGVGVGDKVRGLCLRHEDHDFDGHSITTSDVVRVKVINDKTRLVRTESGSRYLVFCD